MTPWPGFAAALKASAFQASWVLDVLALESDLNPDQLQAGATLVPPTGPEDYRPEVTGSGGLRLSKGSGAKGLWQKMPHVAERYALDHPAKGGWKLIELYPQRDPAKQLIDALEFWKAQKAAFWGSAPLPSREHLYCLNLAPARIQAPFLYAAPSLQYGANAWLDREKTGKITIPMLAPSLDAKHKANEARISCELAALRALLPPGFQGPL